MPRHCGGSASAGAAGAADGEVAAAAELNVLNFAEAAAAGILLRKARAAVPCILERICEAAILGLAAAAEAVAEAAAGLGDRVLDARQAPANAAAKQHH